MSILAEDYISYGGDWPNKNEPSREHKLLGLATGIGVAHGLTLAASYLRNKAHNISAEEATHELDTGAVVFNTKAAEQEYWLLDESADALEALRDKR